MQSRYPRGIILLFLVLLLGITGTAVVFMLAQVHIGAVGGAYEQGESAKVRAAVFGCLDEILIQFSKDPNYQTATVATATATCTSVITNLGGNNRQIRVTNTTSQIVRSLTATIQVSPVVVIEILEP